MQPSTSHGPTTSLRVPSPLRSLFTSKSSTEPTYVIFPILSAIFFYLLWVVMYQNGSADAMNAAVEAASLPNGMALKVRYTGIPPIDGLLAILVAFTYPVTDGHDKASWLLMVDIVSTLQTGLLWAYMESLRFGRKTAWMAYPSLVYLAVNAMGAAAILPMYFYIQLRNHPGEHYIQLWNAKPLMFSVAIGGLLPGLAEIARPLFPASPLEHQNIIAIMQVSPLMVSAIQYVASNLYPIRNIDVRTRKTAYVPSVQNALVLGGIVSALSHLVIVGYVLLGGQSLLSIYMPNYNKAFQAQGEAKLLEGSRLFLQYDYIGITASVLLWCYYLVIGLSGVDKTLLLIGLVAGDLILGPGAVASGVLWWREHKMLEQTQAKKKAI
ncbi:uncharacterized protein Z518_00505 [Rhinocladiella mackenziei CBS 650.93]|uniref:Uncharacterized protein n=1 Tax=Rhinocladiella mackenziei CBS 650.93 TaxID=1442369 RepID=A0A0D2JJ34_9EURO|nr:uncharacterized protein Z518_00505 [Rhinocladiella mackenziei CBS 650.93]KIX09425.1 hypothetical protein Z518_00505 [Rhinocladiella mackenziei CBS 650.93]